MQEEEKTVRQTAVQELKAIAVQLARRSPIGVVRYHDIKNRFCQMKGVPPGMVHIEPGRWDNIRRQLTEDDEYCHAITEVFWSNFGHHDTTGSEQDLAVDMMGTDEDTLKACIPRAGQKGHPVGLRFPRSSDDPLLNLRTEAECNRLKGSVEGFAKRAGKMRDNGLATPEQVKLADSINGMNRIEG